MNLVRLSLFSLFALLVSACGSEPGSDSVPEDKADLQSLRGQWVVINYWAEWCKPCLEEIPELNKLDSAYPAVTVVGINYDGATGEELAQQAQKLDIQFALWEQDPSSELGVARPAVLPTTIVVNPEGEIATTLIGPQDFEALSAATSQH